MAKTTSSDFEVTAHELVPKHELCSDKEKLAVFERYGVMEQQLPRVAVTDPAIQHLGAKEGDLIKITRASLTAGETTFYRVVTME